MWSICGVCTLALTVAKTSSHYDRYAISVPARSLFLFDLAQQDENISGPKGRAALDEMRKNQRHVLHLVQTTLQEPIPLYGMMDTASHTRSALNAGAKRSGATCHLAMPQCCYLGKGAKRPSHTTNTIKFDCITFDPCNSIKRFDLCPFDQKNSTYLQPPLSTEKIVLGPFERKLVRAQVFSQQPNEYHFLSLTIKYPMV